MDIPEVPYGYCHCGCGQQTNIASRTHAREGWIKGEPIKFILGHTNKGKTGERSNRWHGGKRKYEGYISLYQPDHPKANAGGYVGEHILVAEKALGRYLPEGAEPHHVNGNKADNSPGNLVICPDRAYHKLLHQRMRARAACGHAGWRKCRFCKTYDDPQRMVPMRNAQRPNDTYCHRECANSYDRKRRASKGQGVNHE